MDKQKLFDSLNGLEAYDLGDTDSGICDEILRNEIKKYLLSLSDNDFGLLLSEYVRVYFVSEEAVIKGYGIEDVSEFIDWMSDYMGIDI